MVTYIVRANESTQKKAESAMDKALKAANKILKSGHQELLADPAKREFSIDVVVDEQRTFTSPISIEDAELLARQKVTDYRVRAYGITQTYVVSQDMLDLLNGVKAEQGTTKKSLPAGPMMNGELPGASIDHYFRM